MASDSTSLLTSLQQLDLFEPHQLTKVESILSETPDPPTAIRQLVRHGFLTPFQANLVNQGKAGQMVVGPYVLLERLGSGGMGDVFQARHRHIRTRTAALKVVRADRQTDVSSLAARFQREPEIIAMLSHPNIVKVFDAGRDRDQFYLVMEHLEGTDLQQLAKNKPLPVETARQYIAQAARGLEHLDERGMVHRDIKPANLFITKDGTVKILDLGLALLRSTAPDEDTVDELTGPGRVGTPIYWSPEQALNSHNVDVRADIYSLGRTFAYALTGKPPSADHAPFQFAELRKVRPDLPRDVFDILAKMTERDANRRYASPRDLVRALGRGAATKSRLPWRVALGAGVALALVAILATAGWIRSRLAGPADPGGVAAINNPVNKPEDKKPPVGPVVLPVKDPPAKEPLPKDPPKDPPAKDPPAKDPPAKPIDPLPVGDLGKTRVLTQHTGTIYSVAVVPGKAQAVSCSMDEIIWWDLKSNFVLKRKSSGFEPPSPKPKFSDNDFPVQAELKTADEILAERSPFGAVQVEPEGKWALFGGMNSVSVWQFEPWGRRLIFTRKHCGVIGASIDLSADRRYVLHGNYDNLVKLYDLKTGQELSYALPGSLGRFSRDGKKVLTAVRGQTPRENTPLHLFEFETGQPIQAFGGHRTGVEAIAFSPDGKHVASVGVRDKEPVLWNLETYEEVRRFTGHTGNVFALCFSSDGKQLLTGSEDKTARLWNVADGSEIDRFTRHSKAVHAVAFSPNDTYALTGGADQMMGVWQLK